MFLIRGFLKVATGKRKTETAAASHARTHRPPHRMYVYSSSAKRDMGCKNFLMKGSWMLFLPIDKLQIKLFIYSFLFSKGESLWGGIYTVQQKMMLYIGYFCLCYSFGVLLRL